MNLNQHTITESIEDKPTKTELVPLYTVPEGLTKEQFFAWFDQLGAGHIQPDSSMTLHYYGNEPN